MLYSMTGYGKAVKSLNEKTINVEIRSVNSKYLDLNLRLPTLYKPKEIELRKLLGGRFMRGKVDVGIYVEDFAGQEGFKINTALMKNYYQQMSGITDELNINPDNLIASIMRIPDVVTQSRVELDEAEWTQVVAVAQQAADKFMAFRKQEGDAMLKDFTHQVDVISTELEKVVRFAPERVAFIKNKLEKAFKDWNANGKADANRFEQEVVYYLEKLDINEEVVRLRSHCKHFLKVLTNNMPSKGKKLSFISQEMGREINTIGSKANNADMQTIVVGMKDALEKIKEQLMNVV